MTSGEGQLVDAAVAYADWLIEWQADAMAIILKVWCRIRNLTPSINVYLLQKQSSKFDSDPIWNNRASLRSITSNNKMSSDMRSIPDIILLIKTIAKQNVQIYNYIHMDDKKPLKVKNIFVRQATTNSH